MPSCTWACRARASLARTRATGGPCASRAQMGSAALSLTYVANGRFDAYVQWQGLSTWDICAAGLIASEGGAVVTSRLGNRWFDLGMPGKSIGIVAAMPQHHADVPGDARVRRAASQGAAGYGRGADDRRCGISSPVDAPAVAARAVARPGP